MPQFRLETNLPKNKIPETFARDMTALIAKALVKDEKHIAITVIPDMDITLGGSVEPMAMCSLLSVGRISVQENINHSKPMCELIVKHLGVKSNRIYIRFINENAANIGSDYSTFHVLPVS